MKFKSYLLSLCLLLLLGCQAEKRLEIPSDISQGDAFVILDEVLDKITNVWNALPVSISANSDTLSIFKDGDFKFLRLQKKECDVCIVSMISYLNEFQGASKSRQKLYLILDEMPSMEKTNFLSGYQFNNIEVIFIESQLSGLDAVGAGSYFGYVMNDVIIDALPVDQLLVKEFIFSFLQKGQYDEL